MYKFYTVTNNIQPHCNRCPATYPEEPDRTICNTLYGKGKERYSCGGEILQDFDTDWSIELLKDYSVVTEGDLSLHDECFDIINRKLEEAKTGKSAGTGRLKVNIQIEIENYMRRKGVNILNKMNGQGGMDTKSYYKIPVGDSKISEFGYAELAPRFEEKSKWVDRKTGESSDAEGFLTFKEIKKGEAKEKAEKEKKEGFECEECGKVCKSRIGLIAHEKSHK